MLVGAVLITGVIGPLLWDVNYVTLMLFGIGTSLFMPLYLLPVISSVFDLIGKNEDTVEQRVELIVLRELSIMVGRLLGTLLFIIIFTWSPHMKTVIWLMLGLGATPLLSWVLIRKLFKHPVDAA